MYWWLRYNILSLGDTEISWIFSPIILGRVISFWLSAQSCKTAQMFRNSNAQWTHTISLPVTFLFRNWVFVFLSSALPGQQINPGHTKWCLIEQYKINNLQQILSCVPSTTESRGTWRQLRWRRSSFVMKSPAGNLLVHLDQRLEGHKKWRG